MEERLIPVKIWIYYRSRVYIIIVARVMTVGIKFLLIGPTRNENQRVSQFFLWLEVSYTSKLDDLFNYDDVND